MTKRGWTTLTAGILVGGGWLAATPVRACNVPVFRYALERWPADPYEVFVFHQGTLKPDEIGLIERLESSPDDQAASANVRVTTVDLDESQDDSVLKMIDGRARSQLPWMVVRYPNLGQQRPIVWSGKFTEATVSALVDSPIRRALGKRLVSGQSAVWVLVESGDSKQDDQVAKTVEEQLQRMAETLELPAITDGAESVETLTGAAKMELSFSLVRLSRTDEKERIFLKMLLRSEADLETLDEPMAFPVFGRGRALYALVGAGINAENIQEASAFLTGPCSCQVKEENPGTDLLMRVRWDDLITTQWSDEAEGILAGQTEDASAAGDAVSSVLGAAASGAELDGETSVGGLMENMLIVLLLGFLGLGATTGLVVWKAKKNTKRAPTGQ